MWAGLSDRDIRSLKLDYQAKFGGQDLLARVCNLGYRCHVHSIDMNGKGLEIYDIRFTICAILAICL